MSIPNPPPPNSSQRNSIVHLESDSSLHPQPATKILQEKFPLSYEDNNPLSTSKLRPTVRNRRLRTYSKDSGLTKREGEGVEVGFDRDRLRRFEKFHGALKGMVSDLVGEEEGEGDGEGVGEEEDLVASWRFVKDLVEGYVEVKKKLELWEGVGRGN